MIALLIAAVAASISFADADYQSSLERLRHDQEFSQGKLEQLTHRLGGGSIAKSDGDEDSPKGVVSNLFFVHGDNRVLRAQAGKLFYGKTLLRLVVGGDGSPAEVEFNDSEGIFSSLRVLGKAVQSGTSGRLRIDFDRIVARNGVVIPVKATALDEAGAYGLQAQVFSSKALAVAGAMAASFISGLAASQQTETPTAFGFSQVDTTGRNALLQGVAQTAADQSKRLVEEATSERPVLVVDSGTPVTIYLDQEVRF